MIFTWNTPAPDGGLPRDELLLAFDRDRAARLLICPAWFDEANKLRRFTVEVMRRLDAAGIDCFLPDWPGCNESLALLTDQTLEGWRTCAEAAAKACRASHVLAIRAGALLAPAELPGWQYAAQSGPKLLRGMIRSRIIASREAGFSETSDGLLTTGRREGLTLGGWQIGPDMYRALETAEPTLAPGQHDIVQSQLGGPGLWLRAEPAEDSAQADALAAIIAAAMRKAEA